MNILHLTLGIPEYRSGGLVSYAYSVAMTQRKLGYHVTMLYPGNIQIGKKKSYIKTKGEIDGVAIYKIVNPSYVAIPLGIKEPQRVMQSGDRKIYSDFLDSVSPDMVHVHTFMGMHKELFEEIKSRKIPIIYTTHDYYAICPKTARINEKKEVCPAADPYSCAVCNAGIRNSDLMQYVLQSEWYPRIKKSKILAGLKKKRKNTITETEPKTVQVEPGVVELYKKLLDFQKGLFDMVDIVHCNSTLTEQIYAPYLHGKQHFVLNITTTGIVDKRAENRTMPYKENGILNIGYIGIRDHHKGSWILRDAGKILYDIGLKFKISLYGDEFNLAEEDHPFCEDCGMFAHDRISKIMGTLDMLVVPAYWYETFGFSAIEAIVNGVPVLVSSHTGAKDLLDHVTAPHVFEPNAVELAQLLREYIENPKLLDKNVAEQKKMDLVVSMERHVVELMYKINLFVGEEGL